MNFRSVPDLQEDTRHLAHDLPPDVDLVAGIPRSGLLAANLLCLSLDVPMTDVEGLCNREYIETGNRHVPPTSFEEIETVLVFDDSVNSGAQMTETRARLAEMEFPFDVEYGAAYVSRGGHEHVDYWAEVVPEPRVFEWNVMHHNRLGNICVDIDGVLCRGLAPVGSGHEGDDGAFVERADPKIVPNNRIGWLVTSRPERERERTEAWLDEHGVQYDALVMRDGPDLGAGGDVGGHAAFKARAYDETGATLFIEGSERLAREICERTGRPVYCYGSNEMLRPGRIDRASRKSAEYVSRFCERPIAFSGAAGRYALRRFSNRMRREASDGG